jgi:hypothetical protein
MNLFEIFSIAIPEIIVINILTLLLYKKEKCFTMGQYLLRLFITVVYLLTSIYYIRQNVNDLMVSGIIYLVVFTINYKIIWQYNIRQSLFLSFLYLFIIDLSEGITSPVINILIENFKISNIFNSMFIITLPSRIFEIILILVVYLNEIRFNNVLFDKDAKELKKNDKFILLTILFTLCICFISNSNNMNLYIKLEELNVNLFAVEKFLKINLLIPLLFIIITLFLVLRIKKYYEFRSVAEKTPEEIIMDILEVSSEKQIERILTLINNYILKGGETK